MSSFPRDPDLPVWLARGPYLDARANAANTLISCNIVRARLIFRAEADERIVPPAIVFDDVGCPERLGSARQRRYHDMRTD